MTTPDGAPLTEFDPGRGAAPPPNGPPTELDPGRAPLGRGAPTEVDPGRSRPRGASPGLPPGLAARFKVELDITGSGNQADVYHVIRRSDNAQRVLKVHRPGWRPVEQVVQFLSGPCPDHVVGYEETGVDEDRFYEVMAHLTGGTLLDMRDRHPSGVAPDVLTEIVRQLASGLADVHRAGIVHRDVKPANLLVGEREPLTLGIADFGIALHVPAGELWVDETRVGTVPYTPPESVTGQIRPAFDWWSLGVCVLELATGQELFADVEHKNIIRSRLISHPLNTSQIADEGIRLLCDGLLTINPDERWGAEQVTAWLRGERPGVSRAATPDTEATRTAEPYVFAGQEYWDRRTLAADLINDWQLSLSVLCGDDHGPRNRLLAWLAMFPDNGVRIPAPARRAPADVRLLHLIRAVDPTFPPWYRRWNITPGHLALLAQEGYQGTIPSTDIVTELWEHDLFRLLAIGGGTEHGQSGAGLAEVRAAWPQAQEDLAVQARAVGDTGARRAAELFLREERGRALSLALLAATAGAENKREIRRALDEQARAFRLDWFSRLIAEPDRHWIAMALVSHAEAESARLADEALARRAHEDWLRRTEGLRDWSRRQNRPQALSYAAAGVAAIAAVLFALIGLSDVVDFASDVQIIDSWVGVVAALLLGLVSESILAWDSGGRFHPAYSLLGAGRVAVGRLARSLIARRIAGPVAVAVVLGLIALTVFAPAVMPFAVAFSLLPWTVQRSLAWRNQDRREREILARPRNDRPSSNP
ncbi:protein kinase [Amycolatopsis sp. NPDC004169]|uniref:protein kinase domain-containing protein n=1 Tax=Amycolatopsis sp. NPDC004169 TaxID=3154453 RepID=UPI0033A8F4DC